MEFIANNSQRMSGETFPKVILVMDGVGEGNLGLTTTFCHHDQAKAEASKALCPMSMRLTGAKCGFSEEVYQLNLYPLRVL